MYIYVALRLSAMRTREPSGAGAGCAGWKAGANAGLNAGCVAAATGAGAAGGAGGALVGAGKDGPGGAGGALVGAGKDGPGAAGRVRGALGAAPGRGAFSRRGGAPRSKLCGA